MTATCIPASPNFASGAERRVWEKLRHQLPNGAVLISNLRFTANDGDWEADFVVLYPQQGIASIEVKGGHAWHADGAWWQRTPEGDKRIDPVNQALSGKYLLRRYLQGHGLPVIRATHLVAFPDIDWSSSLEAPELPRNRTITRDKLDEAARRIWDALNEDLTNEPKARPTLSDIDKAAGILGGVLTPQRDTQLWREVRDEHVTRMTRGQFSVLDRARRVPRMEVHGGPGSGKSWLALEQTKRLAASGKEVCLIAYSRGLVTWFRRAINEWDESTRRRVWVGTYHALGVQWGLKIPADVQTHFWEDEAPQEMLALAQALPDSERFDCLVVDEAQDFADGWWPPLIAALREPAEGSITVFRDDAQSVFGRAGRPVGVDLVPMQLDSNVRNSEQIASLVAGLDAGESAEALGGEGPAIRFVPCPTEDVYDRAEEEVVALLESGCEPRDVALLTTHHRHPMHVARQDNDGRDGFWDSFWSEDDYFYCTVAGFKGLERPAVVLAVDGFQDPATARDVLRVGVSRARDQLVIVGDLDVIRSVASKEFVKALERARATD
jgi:hypothetical protein